MSDTTAPATRFLESELPLLPAGACRFQVIPVPYEATVSYGGGTARGPQAILDASCQLEVCANHNEPSRAGIHTWPAVDCSGTAEEVLGRIEAAVEAALTAGPQGALPEAQRPHHSGGVPTAPAVPVILGGEHSVTLGALRALKKRCGHFGIIHFDAHADLRDTYQGSPYSHACVMRRAVGDLGLALFQVGVRSLSPEEQSFRTTAGIRHWDASLLQCPRNWAASAGASGMSGCPAEQIAAHGLRLPTDFPERIFLSFDIDALDASLMPATGTPEPGGLLWWDALNLARISLQGRVLLGFDVVELAPLAGLHAPSYTAARLTHELMGLTVQTLRI